MKLRTIIITSVILITSFFIVYNNFYTPHMISGTWVYDFPVALPEGPSRGDSLKLKENGTFESDTWGNGTYILNGSELNLTYEHGTAGFQTNISRPLFWDEPRIDIESDLCYYFKKIN